MARHTLMGMVLKVIDDKGPQHLALVIADTVAYVNEAVAPMEVRSAVLGLLRRNLLEITKESILRKPAPAEAVA
ncbi:MAG: hypothetical protein FJW38_09120 [Acidobacteria bacterium]|nr:hypothetical protein [Acidobacteriota bacterium]